MNPFQITKGESHVSIMVGITDQRADEIASIVLASMWLKLKQVAATVPAEENSTLKNIPAQDIYDQIVQDTFDRVNSTNPGEVFYLGFKFMEAMNTLNNPMKLAFTMMEITKIADDEDVLEIVVGKILIVIKRF